MKDVPQGIPESVVLNTPKEAPYGPDDVVLVLDTSFLLRLASRDLWAFNSWNKVRKIAKDRGKNFFFFMSQEVIQEYNGMHEEGRRDNLGLPLASQTLEELLGTISDIPLTGEEEQFVKALEAWRQTFSLNPNFRNSKFGKGPGKSDLAVIAYARTIAGFGSEVFVGSCDFRDIILPLRNAEKEIDQDALDVIPLAPAPLQAEAFLGTIHEFEPGQLKPVIDREVIADLHVARLRPVPHTYVVFESGVVSGNVIFDVAIQVVECANKEEITLPKGLRKNGRNFYLLPALRMPAVYDQGKRIRGALSRSSGALPYRLLVVEDNNPIYPLLIQPSGKSDGWFRWYKPLHVSRDFLHHQTNSAFGQNQYEPDRLRFKRNTS